MNRINHDLSISLYMEGEELRELASLTKLAFAPKRRLIRRRIEQAYPDGCVP